MMDELDKSLDAVLIATPDHDHAVIAMEAIKRHKHVYVEKPLAHSIGEVRALGKAAKENKVVTQLGNQGHSYESCAGSSSSSATAASARSRKCTASMMPTIRPSATCRNSRRNIPFPPA